MDDLNSSITFEDTYTSGVYVKRDLSILRGEGAVLFDINEEAYIDCVGGQGTCNVGHTHPAVMQTMREQMFDLMICPEIFHNHQRGMFSKALCEAAPGMMNRVFLCNSGTEAVEAALKLARYSTKRTNIIAAMRGFHGRTFGSLSATWNKNYRQPFEPLVPDFSHVPYNNLEKLEAAVNDETAAVILEVVQGEGGVHPGTTEFLQGARRLCRERGALLIIDEVQTGFGRTGRLFACEHHDLEPDILVLGKSIAAGIPMGAVLLGPRVEDLTPGLHGSTFGGNPLACAVGRTVLNIMESEMLPQRAAEQGEYMLKRLQAIQSPLVREVRGMGLILGIEIKQKVAPYLAALKDKGVLALPAGMTVIRLLPPLVITPQQIEKALEALEEVLQ